jgi:hypothetical protein
MLDRIEFQDFKLKSKENNLIFVQFENDKVFSEQSLLLHLSIDLETSQLYFNTKVNRFLGRRSSFFKNDRFLLRIVSLNKLDENTAPII